MNNLTVQLLLVLMLAAILGLLLGLSAMRLHANKQRRIDYYKNRQALDEMRVELHHLQEEKSQTERILKLHQQQASLTTQKSGQIKAQQDAVNVHTRLQTQKIDTLQSELRASEEKLLSLQRDFASFRANKQSELQLLKSNPKELLDAEELPVLNKRVVPSEHAAAVEKRSSSYANAVGNPLTSAAFGTAKRAPVQPIIAHELDIPALAESELPDSVEELEFDLAEGAELNDRG